MANRAEILLIPEFCPGGQRLTCGPTLSTNQILPWDWLGAPDCLHVPIQPGNRHQLLFFLHFWQGDSKKSQDVAWAACSVPRKSDQAATNSEFCWMQGPGIECGLSIGFDAF